MIIETSANQLYQVRETGEPALAHCWIGIEVKRVKGPVEGVFVPKAKARHQLVRKAASRIVVK
jgi:hypothetical protein